MMSNAPNASGLSGISQPPAIAASTRPVAQVPERLAERDRARRARVGRRQDRAAHVERDPEVGRRRAAEDRQREVGRDLADPLLEVALVLLLGVGDATERRAEVDPDPLRMRPAVDARRQPGVVEREPAGDQPELAEPVELARGLGRHPGERVEVVDLGRDLRAERARVEAVDALDRGAAGTQPGPERVEPGPDRGDDADPGDPDAPSVGHGGGFAVRAAGSDSSARASASALNVASVRPAIGRVKARSTNAAKSATRGRKSWSIETREPAADGIDPPRDVHPLGRPGHVREAKALRRRLVPGARPPGDREPQPEHADQRPARDEVDDERAVGTTLERPRPGVVGEQPLPALHVAGEREDEARRGGDVDGDRAVHRSGARVVGAVGTVAVAVVAHRSRPPRASARAAPARRG